MLAFSKANSQYTCHFETKYDPFGVSECALMKLSNWKAALLLKIWSSDSEVQFRNFGLRETLSLFFRFPKVDIVCWSRFNSSRKTEEVKIMVKQFFVLKWWDVFWKLKMLKSKPEVNLANWQPVWEAHYMRIILLGVSVYMQSVSFAVHFFDPK